MFLVCGRYLPSCIQAVKAGRERSFDVHDMQLKNKTPYYEIHVTTIRIMLSTGIAFVSENEMKDSIGRFWSARGNRLLEAPHIFY